jgi:hypothetical protein
MTDSPGRITDGARVLEIMAVVFTGFCKFIFVDYLRQKFWFRHDCLHRVVALYSLPDQERQ